jgi:hypothetical protein
MLSRHADAPELVGHEDVNGGKGVIDVAIDQHMDGGMGRGGVTIGSRRLRSDGDVSVPPVLGAAGTANPGRLARRAKQAVTSRALIFALLQQRRSCTPFDAEVVGTVKRSLPLIFEARAAATSRQAAVSKEDDHDVCSRHGL